MFVSVPLKVINRHAFQTLGNTHFLFLLIGFSWLCFFTFIITHIKKRTRIRHIQALSQSVVKMGNANYKTSFPHKIDNTESSRRCFKHLNGCCSCSPSNDKFIVFKVNKSVHVAQSGKRHKITLTTFSCTC